MCDHRDLAFHVAVQRLTMVPDGPVTGIVAEVTCKCAVCGVAFEFMGLPVGVDTQGSTMSIDGRTAHLAIAPAGSRPNPLHRMGFGVTKFDG